MNSDLAIKKVSTTEELSSVSMDLEKYYKLDKKLDIEVERLTNIIEKNKLEQDSKIRNINLEQDNKIDRLSSEFKSLDDRLSSEFKNLDDRLSTKFNLMVGMFFMLMATTLASLVSIVLLIINMK
ncbi:MAG: hypothetical protein LBQ34_06630 [Alphaproteobacteria bacterium]|jgi:anion-transporting  ArsA/GET3 family ATPase|nr:hypothetical protein [Alphaproteobacteria bacterium]